MNTPALSLCMPTNGVIEWVFPVLDSIYKQSVSDELFEIVITDNGDNSEFKKKIKEYISSHSNIVYAETKASAFINEIESYKLANGDLIKFVNHRTLLVENALQKLIDFALENSVEKPVVYFSNGVLKKEKKKYIYSSFDLFVRDLSYWSSWSTGMTIWKSDFDNLNKSIEDFNVLFPHTDILFSERNRDKYIIDNSIIFKEMPQGQKPKGNYDLYWAFGIEYPGIIFNLLREHSIKNKTFKIIKNNNLDFLANLFVTYNIRKKYTSYNINNINTIFGIFYSKNQFLLKISKVLTFGVIKKLRNIWTTTE